MRRFTNRHWYAAAAGLGAVVIGLTWVLPNLAPYSQELATPDLVDAAPAGPADPELPAGAAAGDPARTEALPETYTSEPEALPVPPPADAAAASRREQDDAAKASAQAGTPGPSLAKLADERRERGQESPAPAVAPAAAPAQPRESEEVIVTGIRANVRGSLEVKREAVAISAGATTAGHTIVMQEPIYQEEGRDQFRHFDVNPVHRAADDPVSTFSADVDTASYSFVRAQLNRGVLPQKDAVRAEEMINYFDYAWPAAGSRRAPFKPTVVISDSPWGKGRKLVHIGIKGYELRDEAPDANLVLLLDVSGSMNAPNKLPLAVRSMELLLDSLKPGDTVGIVVYAGAAGTVLEPTPVREKGRILEALRSLRPGGSTAGAEGIEKAYQMAEANFRKGGVNRILLATDGDFNVGIAGTEELKSFVERKREKGVYLSVLGFGQGNYRDELAQALAQNGNGVAAYIDTENEARKVLVREASSALFTIAKDVKFQVEFDSAAVDEYRLVGYETRALKREDFNNDAVDAGDVGAGHTVTAIYEITPVGVPGSVDELRYQANRRQSPEAGDARRGGKEYGFLKIRYKLPGENESRLMSEPIPLRSAAPPAAVARDVAFSTAVAGFAQLLRGGTYTGSLSYQDVLSQAQASRGEDRFGYRAEFIDLVRRAQQADGD